MSPTINPVYSTITLSEASRQPWDVVVIGAGPAGSVVARSCAGRGARVLLVDRCHFPRYKVCGCCLNGRAVEVIHELGLGGILADAVALEAMEVACHRHRASIGLPGGVVMSRERLDAALVEAAIASGAAFLSGVIASCGPLEGGGRAVILRKAHQEMTIIAGRVVAAGGIGDRRAIKATGIDHRVARRSKVGAGAILDEPPGYFLPGVIYMSVAQSGYVGMTRLEDGRLELAAALDADELARHGDPSAMAAQIVREGGRFPALGFERARWVGTGRLSFRTSRVAAPRLFLVGDACGYVEPFTGEGMAWGLEGAMLLGNLLMRGGWSREAALEAEWCGLYQRRIRRRQRLCRLARMGLGRRSTTALAVRLLSWMPGLAQPFVRAIHVPRRRALASFRIHV